MELIRYESLLRHTIRANVWTFHFKWVVCKFAFDTHAHKHTTFFRIVFELFQAAPDTWTQKTQFYVLSSFKHQEIAEIQIRRVYFRSKLSAVANKAI